MSEVATNSMRRRRLVGGIIGIAILALASLGTYVVRERIGAGGANIGDRVLIADVDNATGDTLFDHGLVVAAATGLQQSARLRLYARSRLPQMYRLMQLDTPVTLTYELAKEVAERDHVPFVVGLHVSRDGEGYRLSARMADVGHGRELGEVEATASMQREVIAALGDVVEKVRRALGETRSELADRRAPLPQVTTSSLEALRSYADGSVAWTRNDYARAFELWQRATDLDTGFALAYGAIGSLYYYTHDRPNGEKYYALAEAHRNRLSSWELLRLRGSEATFRGHRDSAIVIAAKLAQIYPAATTWYDYGTSLMDAHRYDEAVVALHKALAMDSTFVNAWINLATALQHRYDERVVAYEKAGALDSLALYRNNINHEYGSTLLLAGRPADAEKAFRKMAERSRIEDRALGWRSLGYLALWQGKLYESIGDFQQAVAATQQMHSALSEGRNRLLLASVYRAAGRVADADAEVTRAIVLAKAPTYEPTMLALVLYACEQGERLKDMQALASMMRARADTLNPRDAAAVALADAGLLIVRRQPDSALARLRRAKDFSLPILPMMLGAAAFDAKRQRDSVRLLLEQVTAEKGFGQEGQDDFLRAPLLLGDLLLQDGDTVGARRRFQEFALRWKDAPSDAPDMITVKARLAAIGGAAR